MINSRRKGSTFERDMAKQFTKWSGINFKRNWGVERQYIGIVRGDIVPEYTNPIDVKDHPLVLVIECKNREMWNLEDLLLNHNIEGISKWYEQTQKEAMDTMAYPFLIIKKNHYIPLCLFSLKLHFEYFQNSNLLNGSLLWTSIEADKKIILPLCNFFLAYEYKKIEKLVKEKIKDAKNENGNT